MVVSGGFFSSHEAINPAFVRPLLDRGYTVFAVVHGSQPRYTVPEIIKDMNRAVRFIRHHAKDYGIDPDRIGVIGRLGRRAPLADAGHGRRQGRPRRPRTRSTASRAACRPSPASSRRPTSSTTARRAWR